ncbi:MAG TPA: thioredoxin family protein [Rhodobacteraceae bacterium]|nr:thioredoxin family protein [Paracoccaceae bacterium]
MVFRLLIFLSAAFLAFTSQAAELIMVDQDGCVYCEQWEEEIGPIYPKTAESAVAPLRHIDIYDQELDQLELARDVHFTPTFILVDDGRELARIEGYPGEDFFWGLLGMMLEKHTAFEGES